MTRPMGDRDPWFGLPIFSLLFGIGFALLDSAANRVPRPRLVLLRRLLGRGSHPRRPVALRHALAAPPPPGTVEWLWRRVTWARDPLEGGRDGDRPAVPSPR
ncbi:hypothetical protein [Nonomuraea jabiensis]|uniref:Uncharacterized protein n=1 Tax=Nonomuraea jabiensis TaxID=882448 RepID=A0A7W9LDM5_9ACTN|nr:hypothetical protein [Nonomuraea jabiensis]MBB5779939.1 hypothetical protein [Nonomuraea jabiensis]